MYVCLTCTPCFQTTWLCMLSWAGPGKKANVSRKDIVMSLYSHISSRWISHTRVNCLLHSCVHVQISWQLVTCMHVQPYILPGVYEQWHSFVYTHKLLHGTAWPLKLLQCHVVQLLWTPVSPKSPCIHSSLHYQMCYGLQHWVYQLKSSNLWGISWLDPLHTTYSIVDTV